MNRIECVGSLQMRERQERTRKSLWLVICCALLTCTTARTAETVNIQTVKVGYLPMVSSLTYFVAMEQGYFLDERLQIDATPIKTSDGLAQELVANRIDMAVELSITPLLQSIGASGPGFRIFSVSKIEDATAFDGVLVKANSTIRTLEDLSGKKVSVFPGTTAKVCFESVFKTKYPQLPLPIFDNQIKPAEQLNALMRGDVDAVHAYEPIVTIGIDKFGLRCVFGSIYAAQLSPNPIGVAAFSRTFTVQSSDSAKRVTRAMDKAVNFIQTNPVDARAILAKYTGAEPGMAERMRIMPMSISAGIDKSNLNAYLTILRELGLSQSTATADDVCVDFNLAK